jgi:hypothetical protein
MPPTPASTTTGPSGARGSISSAASALGSVVGLRFVRMLVPPG